MEITSAPKPNQTRMKSEVTIFLMKPTNTKRNVGQTLQSVVPPSSSSPSPFALTKQTVTLAKKVGRKYRMLGVVANTMGIEDEIADQNTHYGQFLITVDLDRSRD